MYIEATSDVCIIHVELNKQDQTFGLGDDFPILIEEVLILSGQDSEIKDFFTDLHQGSSGSKDSNFHPNNPLLKF